MIKQYRVSREERGRRKIINQFSDNREVGLEKEINRRIEMDRCIMVKLNEIWKVINRNVKVKSVKALVFSVVLRYI